MTWAELEADDKLNYLKDRIDGKNNREKLDPHYAGLGYEATGIGFKLVALIGRVDALERGIAPPTNSISGSLNSQSTLFAELERRVSALEGRHKTA